MKNVIAFPGLFLSCNPKYFPQTNTVEFRASDYDDLSGHPRAFKFTHQGEFAAQFPKKFKAGDVVHIQALAEAYQAKVYGKMGKPIKYPDGTWRYTTKTRFHVITIKAGLLNI